MGGILELIRANAARNCKLLKANFNVLSLDFFARGWCPNFEAKLTNVTMVLVADGEENKSFEITVFLTCNILKIV